MYASSFIPSPSFYSDSPHYNTQGSFNNYDVARGLKKVHLKGKGLATVSRLIRRRLEVRNLKGSVSDFQWCHT